MKKQIFAMTTLLALGFASCVNEGVKTPVINEANVAYLSINVETQKKQTRGGSDERADSDAENAIKSLYLVTFDDAGILVGIPGGSSNFIAIIPGTKTPEPVKISAAAKNLMVIANPGTKLLSAINTLTTGSTFANFNAAIAAVTIDEIVGDSATGFAMITAGDEMGGSPILNPYVDIDGKLTVVTTTEAAAKAEAATKPVPVKLERLAAKLAVKEQDGGATTTQKNAIFEFVSWTVDAVNGTYFPFAKKTLGDNHKTVGGDYAKNFYTEDPNYSGNTGIVIGGVDAANNGWSYKPVLPWTSVAKPEGYYGWILDEGPVYVIENTMAAAEQKFENATRLVIRALYYPAGFTAEATAGADWFHWAGVNYNFEQLKAKYTLDDDAAFVAACDKFYEAIKSYYQHNMGGTTPGDNFADMDQDDLNNVQHGGDVSKDGKNAVIRWYQGGMNYYYYEIRHDNEADGSMAFGKYGVVRNNWYDLTLNNVSGAGTPWYPDINKPGPGDPDPTDPIDDEVGYLGVTVNVNKWIVWDTNFDI